MQCGEAKLPSAVLEKGRKRTVFHIFTRQFHITKVLINVCNFFIMLPHDSRRIQIMFQSTKVDAFCQVCHLCQIICQLQRFSGKKNQHSWRWFSNNIPTVDLIFHKSSLMEERGWLMSLTTAVFAASLIRICIEADNRSVRSSALIYTKQMKKKLPCMMQPASLQKCIFRASLNQVHPQSNWFKLCVLVFHSITCGWRVESAAPEENRRKKGGKDRGQNTDCFREREIEIMKQLKAWVQTVEKFCKTLAKSGKLKWISLEFY